MNKKRDPFYKRFWHFIKQYPVIVALAIIVPQVIYSTLYIFSPEFVYQNLYYTGVSLNIKEDEFAITGIAPIFDIMDISSFSNYQGGTCYQNYYLLCSNNFECILIYNMDSKKVEHTIFTNATNTDYHCNTCFFGSAFYSSVDKFPILYISMENEGVETTFGYRIYSNGGTMSITQIQKIHFVCDNGDKLFYPNSYYDYDADILYYSGYTQKSYMKSDDNLLRYYAFYMPDYRLAECDVLTSRAIKTFDLPSETATQGGFISHFHLYQTFSFNSDSDPLRMPKMRVVDLNNETIVYENQNLGVFGHYDEFENIAACRNGHIYGFGVKTLKIYDFSYSGKTN